MKITLKSMLLIALALIPAQLSAVSTIILVKMPTGQHVIIYADVHNLDDVLGKPGTNKKHIDIIFDEIEKAPRIKQFPFILEHRKELMQHPERTVYLSSTITDVLQRCRALICSGKPSVLLIPDDPRGDESDFITGCNSSITGMIQKHTPAVELCRFHKIEDPHLINNLRSLPNSIRGTFSFADDLKRLRTFPAAQKFTIGVFFEYLDDCIARMERIKNKHKPNVVAYEILEERINTFIEAQTKIREILADVPRSAVYGDVYVDLFRNDSSSDAWLNRLVEYERVFLKDCDYLYADVYYFDQLLDQLNKGADAALYVGTIHAKALFKMLQKMGCEVLVHETIECLSYSLLTTMYDDPNFESKIRDCTKLFLQLIEMRDEGVLEKQCLNCFAQDKLKIGDLCKHAFFCSHLCKKIAAPGHKQFHVREVTAKRALALEEAKVAAVVTGTCAHCQKTEARSICGACKKVFYCNAICQKAAWAEHKKECTKVKVEIAL